ncbi:MAG: hypothetical protein M1820_010243 [Bogoriella megaspora]|nr:MAG: hypothetical protein M1820_010243 [Bogoriella megaspora]
MQRSTGSSEPSNDPVKLTKTGRISKAKKGLRVHDCETCGKRYTRAEHLRRHQLNHSTGSLRCNFVGCNRTFHREDLLLRHRERHLEASIGQGQQESPQSQSSPEAPSGPSRYTSISGPSTSGSPSNIATTASSTWTSSSATTPYISAPSTEKTGYPGHHRNNVPAPVLAEGNWDYSGDYNHHGHWMSSQYPASSGGYGSPNYPNLIGFAGQPTHVQLLGRQAPFSSTSLIEQFPLQQVPHTKSPTSPKLSNIAPYWTEWNTEPDREWGSISSAPLTLVESRSSSIAPTPPTAPFRQGLPHFDFVSMAHLQRDMLEGADFGFRQDDDNFEQQEYINQYWELSHHQFPILNRRIFFPATTAPLLKAAVLAIGAQHSIGWNAMQYSRKLHEQCLKCLARRLQEGYETKRLQDMQAVFLVELYAQYMSRRTPQGLSDRFKELYRSLSLDPSLVSAMPLEYILSLQPQSQELSLPAEWAGHGGLIKFISKRRLLAACYVLDSQKRTLFPQSGTNDDLSGLHLPFPSPTTFWDNCTPEEATKRRETAEFAYLSEVLDQSTNYASPRPNKSLDTFSSALLVAGASESGLTVLDPTRLESSSQTQLLHLVTVLASKIPLRAILAVAGETWIMGEKVSTVEEYQTLRTELRFWADKDNREPAITTALAILRRELNRSTTEGRSADATLVEQWAIYLAGLVVWAAGYTALYPTSSLSSGVLRSQKGGDGRGNGGQMPVAAALSAIERDKWDIVAKSDGVVGVLSWVRGKINGSANGLVVEAVLVLGKLVARGTEEGWF